MRTKLTKYFDELAKENGYENRYRLFADYGFMLTVLPREHTKIEFLKLLIKRSKKGIKVR